MSNVNAKRAEISRQIRERRIALGLSQGQVADFANIERKTVMRVELDGIGRIENLFKICNALNLDIKLLEE